MQRRNFINTSAIGATFLASNGVFAFEKVDMPDFISCNPIDPFIPLFVYQNYEDEILSQMIEMRTKYGFRRFSIMTPQKTIRYSGFPEPEVYTQIGELILDFKKKLAPYDIKVGWGCNSTIKQGPGGPYQYLTGLDGKASEISYCPLDKNFREVLSNNITTVVELAQPYMIEMMDDFTLRHAGGFGCFCPLHLAEFAQRQGHYYSREDLYAIFSNVTSESIRLRRAWAELSRDSLAGLADLIRQKVDKVHPETRILFNQPGGADFDGNLTELVTKTFAGNSRPAVRLYGTNYGSDNAENMPETLFHALYGSQHLPPDFELYHESDTFPHTRFFMSAAKIKSLMTVAYAYGIDDSRFNAIQKTDNPLEDSGYANMFVLEKKRFNAIKNAVKDCEVEGCEIMYDPFEHIVDAYGKGGTKRYAWANVTGRLGIPHSSAGCKVKMISGNTVEVMNDDEILKLLSGSIFLDGKAAYLLYKRGFKDMIGADVLPGGQPRFLVESIRETVDFKDISGRIMYNFLLFGSVGTEGGTFFQLKPLEGAEILTDFLDADRGKPVTPGMIRFVNKLGGRVLITAFDLNNNSSSAVINYKKKEIMRQMIEWLGNEPLPVFVKHKPNIFCVFNRSKSNDYAIVVIVSLCSDPFDSISLDVAPEWLDSKFELLNNNGTWDIIKVETQGRTIKINTQVSLMNPVIIKFNQT